MDPSFEVELVWGSQSPQLGTTSPKSAEGKSLRLVGRIGPLFNDPKISISLPLPRSETTEAGSATFLTTGWDDLQQLLSEESLLRSIRGIISRNTRG